MNKWKACRQFHISFEGTPFNISLEVTLRKHELLLHQFPGLFGQCHHKLFCLRTLLRAADLNPPLPWDFNLRPFSPAGIGESWSSSKGWVSASWWGPDCRGDKRLHCGYLSGMVGSETSKTRAASSQAEFGCLCLCGKCFDPNIWNLTGL